MDRRYSPISDMYGMAPDGPFRRRKTRTWIYVLLTIAGFFALQSIQPVMRLRPDPPQSLGGASLSPVDLAHASQPQIARACWDYAVASVQNVFPYGGDLPTSPPAPLVRRRGNASAVDLQCWPGLRRAWKQPQSWVRSYKWSTAWVTDPNGPVQGTISQALEWFGIKPW
ncbi:MAG TPA: hypothetical protein VFZ27_12290 [Terriglobia bacterium]|nr:hypothetical protein [Terriglobia bacterium]